jgi:hypothetical protein
VILPDDLTRPGTFYIDRTAERDGLIATLRFPRPLRLWHLNSDASSKLGIVDMLSSPDYEWCQWFGVRLHDAIGLCDDASRPDGSCMRRGDTAAEQRSSPRRQHERFVDHDAYRGLVTHPVRPPLFRV